MKSLNRRNFIQLGLGTVAVTTLSSCATNENVVTIDTSLPTGVFGSKTTAEQVTEGLDLSGKTAIVTGCNSGLGLETMRVLALRGAHVIGTGRTIEKARTACDSVIGKTTAVALELSDFQSAVDCAQTIKALGIPIDMLICNAGINTFGELELVDGIERIFRVNHLGHFVLVNNLLPLLQATAGSRIVHVGSMSGYSQAPSMGIDFTNLRGEKAFDAEEAYGRSKLANALFSLQLSKNLEATNTTSNVIHPGLVVTNIVRSASPLIRKGFEWIGPFFAKTPDQGAATQVYVATNPMLSGVSGAYFEDCNPVIVAGHHHIDDEEMASKLWQVSMEMTKGFV